MAFRLLQIILWASIVVFFANMAWGQGDPGWVFQRDGTVWMTTHGPLDMGLVPDRLHLYPVAWDMELCLAIGTGDSTVTRCQPMHEWHALGKEVELAD